MLVLAWWQRRITLPPGVNTHVLPLGGWQRNVAENGLIESGGRYLEFCAVVPYGANGSG